MTLLGIHSISKSFGSQVLFEGLEFTISQGDRIGLVGPNGSGKSTLLKIIARIEPPDKGSISRRQNLRIGYSSQVPEFPDLDLEQSLIQSVPHKGNEHEWETRARILLGKAQFTDFAQNAQKLSGGWKKRLDIVRALMQEPDLLLLDEPTNHLDLEGILWLEKFLAREKISYVVVSHDRYFLESISNKVIEINRCFPEGLFASDGNYSTYLEHKQLFLENQKQMERGLAAVVRDEIDWLRRSPKARTTKSLSRINRAEKLIEELSDVRERNRVQKINLDFSTTERETRKLIVGKNLAKSLGNKQLFMGVDVVLSPGTRLGIVGKNGTGKTTLLRLLARMLPPDLGTIKYAEELKLVYFDQHREHIPPNVTLKQALSPSGDMVNYRGQYIHVNGWAKKFLFSPDRMELPVGCLSGGERARILIARFMLEPADVLFLDEPTNDLDIQTLEVIEESLKEFPGAVVLISHDRCLMDRVCTQILGLGEGLEQQLFADYSQWEDSIASLAKQEKKEADAPKAENRSAPVNKQKKLSYKEQKELEGMEEAIAKKEDAIAVLQKSLEKPGLQAQESLDLYKKLGDSQHELEALYHRWQELLDKAN